MPIYEFVCQDCRSPFEKLVLRSGEPIVCPSCGSSNHQIQLSLFRTKSGKGSSGPSAAGGACGCTPSTCGCH